MRRSFFAPVFVALIALGYLACTGDDPSISPRAGDGGGADGTTVACAPGKNACGGRCVELSDTTACGAACTACPVPKNGAATCDGKCGVICNPNFTACGDACVNLEDDPANCGHCGRSCGGQACTSTTCGTIKVAALVDGAGLAVGPTNVYARTTTGVFEAPKSGGGMFNAILTNGNGWDFSSTIHAASSIHVSGANLYFSGLNNNTVPAEAAIWKRGLAPSAPEQKVTLTSCTNNASDCSFATDGTTFAWLDSYSVWSCTGAGCAAPPALNIASGGQGQHIALHKDYLVWTSSLTASTVLRCTRSPLCGTYDVLVTSAQSPKPTQIVVQDNDVYWLDVDTINGDKGRIMSCPITGCVGNPRVLVKGEYEMKGLAVDNGGIYFTVEGNSATPAGVVKVCRDLVNGCGTTSEILAPAQPQAEAIVLDDKFAYWINLGVSSAPTTPGVYRVAK